VAELGRPCQEGLFVAAERNKREEVSIIEHLKEVRAQSRLSGH
jgi:hypothetical protein